MCLIIRFEAARRISVCLAPIVNSQHPNEAGRFEGEKDSPLADPQPKFTGAVSKGFHIAMSCGGVTNQGSINTCLDDSIKALEIADRSRTEDDAASHSPSWRRTSSRGTSPPGSARAKSNLAAVSASTISSSPSSARKENATSSSVSGRASTSWWRRLRSADMPLL